MPNAYYLIAVLCVILAHASPVFVVVVNTLFTIVWVLRVQYDFCHAISPAFHRRAVLPPLPAVYPCHRVLTLPRRSTSNTGRIRAVSRPALLSSVPYSHTLLSPLSSRQKCRLYGVPPPLFLSSTSGRLLPVHRRPPHSPTHFHPAAFKLLPGSDFKI